METNKPGRADNMSEDFFAQNKTFDKVESFKFTQVGDTLAGTVKDHRKVTSKNLNTGLMTDKIVVDIETDSGEVYAIWLESGTILTRAVSDALIAAGQKNLTVGWRLAVQHTSTVPSKTQGFADAKLYEAKYSPAVKPSIDLSEF